MAFSGRGVFARGASRPAWRWGREQESAGAAARLAVLTHISGSRRSDGAGLEPEGQSNPLSPGSAPPPSHRDRFVFERAPHGERIETLVNDGGVLKTST